MVVLTATNPKSSWFGVVGGGGLGLAEAGAFGGAGTELSLRLATVQFRIAEPLDRCPPGTIRLVSMCAGVGRDVLPVVAAHRRRADVSARLVELDPAIAADASAAAVGVGSVDVAMADAGLTDSYEGAVPADVVVACGVFGNLTDDSIERTIASLPQLCAPGATVVWTRYQRNEHAVPDVLGWFSRHGFELLATSVPEGTNLCVGAHRLVAKPQPLQPGARLFEFVDERTDDHWRR